MFPSVIFNKVRHGFDKTYGTKCATRGCSQIPQYTGIKGEWTVGREREKIGNLNQLKSLFP